MSDPNLSEIERRVLSDLRTCSAVVNEYIEAVAVLQRAEAEHEAALGRLMGISPQSARNLAEFDPRTRPLLAEAGLLAAERGQVDPGAVAVDPGIVHAAPAANQGGDGPAAFYDHNAVAAADHAVDLLKKRVSVTPRSSFVDSEQLTEVSDEEIIETEYHANMEDCTKDTVVYWPEDRESLLD